MKISNKRMFNESVEAVSVMGDLVEIIGEQTAELEDGRVVEQFLYNIKGYTPENGLPFASLKANISLLGQLPEDEFIEDITGETFKNEAELEKRIQEVLGENFKDVFPVITGLIVRTKDGDVITIVTEIGYDRIEVLEVIKQ